MSAAQTIPTPSGSHTVQLTRYVIRRLEAGDRPAQLREALCRRGVPPLRSEALVAGALAAYEGLFSIDGRRYLETTVTLEGVPPRVATLIVRAAVSELERTLAFAVPFAIARNRAQLVPRMQQKLGLSFRSARAFARLVINVVDRVLLELGPHDATFPDRDDVIDQLHAEGQPRLLASRIVAAVYGYFIPPTRAAG